MSSEHTTGALTGHSVMVTGAGSGLGEAYAWAIARAGGAVVANDYDAERAESVAGRIRAAGGDAVAVPGSVADETVCRQMADTAVSEFGKLTGLVNNAGVFLEGQPWEQQPGDIRRVVETNVLGPLLAGTFAIDAMRSSGGGAIVNVASGAALGMRRQSAYAASKGAMVSLTYAWALDLAEVNIRVNTVSPRAFTPMIDSAEVTRATVTAEELPEAVAPLVVYLLSDLSDEVSGQFIRFDRGEITLVSPPQFARQIGHSTAWTPDQLELAFSAARPFESYGLQAAITAARA